MRLVEQGFNGCNCSKSSVEFSFGFQCEIKISNLSSLVSSFCGLPGLQVFFKWHFSFHLLIILNYTVKQARAKLSALAACKLFRR